MLEQLAKSHLEGLLLENPDATKDTLKETLEAQRLNAAENGDEISYAICEEAFYMILNNDFILDVKEAHHR